ncbi:ATP-dependent zinc protease [Flavobacteriaceae bacterium MHTCC 0001]
MTKKIIGRVDSIDFPKLNLYNVNSKIDTGAYTSAIHCYKVEEKDGVLYCYFTQDNTNQPIIFKEYTLTDVKSSNGYKENRFKIKSEVVLFRKSYRINLTLSTRDDMKFPVLIGRQFLNKKFLVDVDLEYVSQRQVNNEHSYSL